MTQGVETTRSMWDYQVKTVDEGRKLEIALNLVTKNNGHTVSMVLRIDGRGGDEEEEEDEENDIPKENNIGKENDIAKYRKTYKEKIKSIDHQKINEKEKEELLKKEKLILHFKLMQQKKDAKGFANSKKFHKESLAKHNAEIENHIQELKIFKRDTDEFVAKHEKFEICRKRDRLRLRFRRRGA